MAQGSHQTLSPDDARTCCVCGKPLVVKTQSIRHCTSLGIGFHVACDVEGWRIVHEMRAR